METLSVSTSAKPWLHNNMQQATQYLSEQPTTQPGRIWMQAMLTGKR